MEQKYRNKMKIRRDGKRKTVIENKIIGILNIKSLSNDILLWRLH